LSEKILAIQRVNRTALFGRTIGEILFFTRDRVIIARTEGEGSGIGVLFGAVGAPTEAAIAARKKKKKDFFEIAKEGKFFELHPEDILKSNKHNYAILNSEITKVERKGRLRFHIKTSKKTHKWYAGIVISDEMMAKGDNPCMTAEEMRDRDSRKRFEAKHLEDYEKVLRPIFGDRLLVK
jgi:hypothetical protein